MSDRLQRHRWVGWLTVALLLMFAFAHLVWRGPISVRGHWNLVDFASPWASARLWLMGQNPYAVEKLWETWINSRGAFDTDHEFWLALLPPGAFAAMAPLAVMPAGAAAIAWLAISAISVLAILACTLSLARIPLKSLTAWLLIAMTLAMAPMQTLLTVGQISLPTIALLLTALWLAHGRRDLPAGLALGLAATLKPQLAASFLLYYLFFTRWRVFAPALLVVIALNLLAIIPMQLRGIPWMGEWSRNIATSTAPGGPNDTMATGPWRQQMIDLRLWFSTLSEDRDFVVRTALIVSMLIAAAYVALLVRAGAAARTRQREGQATSTTTHAENSAPAPTPAQGDQLLPLATLAALTLLPVYHRAYDAAILVLALAWALRAWGDRALRPIAALTLLAMCVFFIPFDFLVLVMKRTPALDALAQTWFWRVFIFPHYAVATLAVGLSMLCAFWLSVRRPRQQAQSVEETEDELEDVISA